MKPDSSCRAWALALAVLMGAGPVGAGPVGAQPSAVYSAPLPVDSDQVARQAVDIFRRTCLTSVGEPAALVDAAINAGLSPYAAGSGDDAGAESLLDDAPGQLFAPAGSTDLLLAISDDGRCTVWASRADGPALRQAFVAALDAMRAGMTVRAVRDRKIQRGSVWRHQLGYDVAGARLFSADAVTLLASQPGVQVLRATPSNSSRDGHDEGPRPAR